MSKENEYENNAPMELVEEEPATENILGEVCSVPQVVPEVMPAGLDPGRLEAIIDLSAKWVNGTTLRYYFFDRNTDGRNVQLVDGTTEFRPWTTTNAEKDVVRRAFDIWKNVGIGINFQEVSTRDEAEIRIGFERRDGAWSYVGRDIIDLVSSRDKRTMNFGWDLTRRPEEIDTAVHEIGHTLGLNHEHQNPFSGIVWDEEAVYADLAKPPNRWDRDKTFFNIIQKISPDTVQGSSWDPDSIMHYPFKPGLVKEPAQFNLTGINPAGGLSTRDASWIQTFYPPIGNAPLSEMVPAESVKLSLGVGEQKNLSIIPNATRDYQIGTFGTSDAVIVLFEDVDGELRFLAGDDDSGEDRNALISVKLRSGRKYVLRVRMYFAEIADETSVMFW